MAFHNFPGEFHSRHAITALCDNAIQSFPFVIHSPPEVVRLAVDFHEHLAQRCHCQFEYAGIWLTPFLRISGLVLK
jgi:hypothetical protein